MDRVSILVPNEGIHHPYSLPVSNLLFIQFFIIDMVAKIFLRRYLPPRFMKEINVIFLQVPPECQ